MPSRCPGYIPTCLVCSNSLSRVGTRNDSIWTTNIQQNDRLIICVDLPMNLRIDLNRPFECFCFLALDSENSWSFHQFHHGNHPFWMEGWSTKHHQATRLGVIPLPQLGLRQGDQQGRGKKLIALSLSDDVTSWGKRDEKYSHLGIMPMIYLGIWVSVDLWSGRDLLKLLKILILISVDSSAILLSIIHLKQNQSDSSRWPNKWSGYCCAITYPLDKSR